MRAGTCVLGAVALGMLAGVAAADERPLDLDPPHISELFLPAELEHLLNEMIVSAGDLEEVEVEGERFPEPPPWPTPAIWPGIAAPFWAVANPADAWRIFLPWPPEHAAAFNRPPDPTSTGLPPAAWTSAEWPYR